MQDYSDLKQQILNDIRKDSALKTDIGKFNQKIRDKSATYDDAVKLSKSIGDTTSKCLKASAVNVTNETLAEYAEEIIQPVYTALQSTSLSASKQVQAIFNDQVGIQMNPADVKPNASRIKHIVDRFKEASLFDDVSFLLGEAVAENIARGAVTDSLKENAKQYDAAGFETYVIREGSGCCAWCDEMTGKYSLDELPNDFWRVHKDCTCSFEYKAKNTHTKITYSTNKGVITKNTTNI